MKTMPAEIAWADGDECGKSCLRSAVVEGSMLEALYRVIWNTNEWRCPAGAARSGSSYVEENGFGHEEWLFQTCDAFRGEMFGYVYAPPSKLFKIQGRGRVGFWSIEPVTSRRVVVGFYEEALPVQPEEIRSLHAYYEQSGIYERRVDELLAVVPTYTRVKARRLLVNPDGPWWLRIKCSVERVHALAPGEWIDLPRVVGGTQLGMRFRQPTYFGRFTESSRGEGRRSASKYPGRTIPPAGDGYIREVGARRDYVTQRHVALQKKFATWVEGQGARDIEYEREGVDVEFRWKAQPCRAEVKVALYGSRHGIREALGQLLEYNYYGYRKPASRWYIVLDVHPSLSDVAYICRVRQKLGLPVRLAWAEERGFEVVPGRGL